MKDFIWDDTRVFLALARCGTLTTAAKSLGMSIATLSRKVERLEKNINTPLFLRFQTGYQLTDEGIKLVAKAERMEAAVFAFADQVNQESQLTGRVKLATAENLAVHFILPNLPRFQLQYPNLHLDIITDINTVNLHRRDADIALRMVKPSSGHLRFRRVGQLGYGLYASSSYLQQKEEGKKDDFIGWAESYEHLPSYEWIKSHTQEQTCSLTTTSVATQVSACRAGMGVALLPHIVTKETDLVCIKKIHEMTQEIYMVMQADLAQSQRIRIIADFLASIVEKHQHELT